MIRFLIRAGIFLSSAAVGLLAAAVLIDGVSVSASGFIITVVVYATAQSIVSPAVLKFAVANARALLGGIGLISTLIALFVASRFTNSLTLSGGISTWILAALVVWTVTAIATLFLPMALVKAGVQAARERRK